jgi:hypothetical protein
MQAVADAAGGRVLDPRDGQALAAENLAAFERALAAASPRPERRGSVPARADSPNGLHERHYVLSGRVARVRVVGDELAQLLHLPFAHLEVDADPSPALAIDLWDPVATGVDAPKTSLEAIDPAMRPAVAVTSDGRLVGHRLLNTLTWLDRRASTITGAVDLSRRLTLFETGRPLYFPLMLWLRDRRVQFVHAGLVAKGGDGLVLCGQGGSGKSTTTLLCLDAGFDFLGDDYVGLERRGGGFVGHSLFCSTYLDPAGLERFPDLDAHAVHGTTTEEDKSVVLVSQVWPARLAASARIRAVLLPEVSGESTTRIEKASRGYALRRAAPSSILQLLAPEPSSLGRISALVETTPCYRVALGRDRERIPVLLDELLTSLVASAQAETADDR